MRVSIVAPLGANQGAHHMTIRSRNAAVESGMSGNHLQVSDMLAPSRRVCCWCSPAGFVGSGVDGTVELPGAEVPDRILTRVFPAGARAVALVPRFTSSGLRITGIVAMPLLEFLDEAPLRGGGVTGGARQLQQCRRSSSSTSASPSSSIASRSASIASVRASSHSALTAASSRGRPGRGAPTTAAR